MSLAEKQALALRDLAVIVAKAKGVIIAPNLYAYHDARIRIEYKNGKPQALDLFKLGDMASRDPKVLSVIWNDDDRDDDFVVLLHRGGSWEDSLRRLAKGC
jgi:hypothetical protein